MASSQFNFNRFDFKFAPKIAVVEWILEKTHDQEVVSSNPSAEY